MSKKKDWTKIEVERIRASLILTIVNTAGVATIVIVLLTADVDSTILERVTWMGLGWIAANLIRKY